MKAESIDILKQKIIRTYRKHGDEPYLRTNARIYTGNEIADEIEKETEFGVECVNKLIQLTIDLLARDKMKYESKPEVNPQAGVEHKDYSGYIGKKVHKPKSDRPFKSGFKINTVKGVIEHPILGIPAYTFEEDDSYVECRRCAVAASKATSVYDCKHFDEHQGRNLCCNDKLLHSRKCEGICDKFEEKL